jgi:hypothetical protein
MSDEEFVSADFCAASSCREMISRLTRERNEARAEVRRLESEAAAVLPEDVGVVEYVGALRAEIDRLKRGWGKERMRLGPDRYRAVVEAAREVPLYDGDEDDADRCCAGCGAPVEEDGVTEHDSSCRVAALERALAAVDGEG